MKKDGQDGKDGEPGKDGKDGAPGRGISSAKCVDGRWEITYTDDTTNDGGPCMPQPGPTVTETVTVSPEPTEEETQ